MTSLRGLSSSILRVNLITTDLIRCCLNPSVLAKGHNSRPDCMSWKNVSLCSYKLNVVETRKVSLCSVNWMSWKLEKSHFVLTSVGHLPASSDRLHTVIHAHKSLPVKEQPYLQQHVEFKQWRVCNACGMATSRSLSPYRYPPEETSNSGYVGVSFMCMLHLKPASSSCRMFSSII